MTKYLTNVIGVIVAMLYGINVAVMSLGVYLIALLKLIPIAPWQRFCHRLMHNMPIYWADVCHMIERRMSRIEWDIQGIADLKHDDWYLVVCNHQSWTDILVLEQVFNRKIPVLKFFMKKELLWTLPFGGFGAWLLDFPFMERYSKDFLAKHPELKGKDMETTRQACAKFRNTPTAVISFVEATRFTSAKQARQNSPYKNLLRPRAGSIAFALGAMGDQFNKILNVTIVYPQGPVTIWDYFCGRIKKITVRVEVLPVTQDLLGDYENDRGFRARFQSWINQLWQSKDQLIESLK